MERGVRGREPRGKSVGRLTARARTETTGLDLASGDLDPALTRLRAASGGCSVGSAGCASGIGGVAGGVARGVASGAASSITIGVGVGVGVTVAVGTGAGRHDGRKSR